MTRFSQFLIPVFFLFSSSLFGNDYQSYFTTQGLRIDFFQVGNRNSETVVLDELYQEEFWSGNPHNLIDTLNLGQYLIKVMDLNTNILIYSSGFSTLFYEWKTTQEALSGAEKVMRATLRLPFPRKKVQLEFVKRDRENHFSQTLTTFKIDPSDVRICRENRAVGSQIFKLGENGPSDEKVDLLFLGEGYTSLESQKFESDLSRATEILFSVEPFKSNRTLFNVTGVVYPSHETGVDNPSKDIFKNTVMNFTFNTFGSQRYLMTLDPRRLNDIASAAPHDAIIVLINTDIYGGGGIYNLYAALSVDNDYLSNILLHELGHSFGGLGDEYYSGDVAYYEFYPVDVEPWEPNLTVQKSFQKLKWNKFLTPGIEIPTSWGKSDYESLNKIYQERLKELNRSNSNAREIEKLKENYREKIRNFFGQHRLRAKTGIFEGAGYSSTGLYRPSLDCIMFSNRTLKFDIVCTAAIQKRIHFLTHQKIKKIFE
jgi:hypothetical protein